MTDKHYALSAWCFHFYTFVFFVLRRV